MILEKKRNHLILIDQTKLAHESLHCHPKMSRLFEKGMTQKEYCTLLCSYYGFYKGIENTRVKLNCWSNFSLYYIISLMSEDLRVMDIAINQLSVLEPFWIANEKEMLGSLYVLQGSSFGNKIIASQLNKALPNASLSYFRHPLDISLWASILDAIELEDDNLNQLIDSANVTFNEFYSWL